MGGEAREDRVELGAVVAWVKLGAPLACAFALLLCACTRLSAPVPFEAASGLRGLGGIGPAIVNGDLMFVTSGCGVSPPEGMCIYTFPEAEYVGWIDDYAGSALVQLCSDSGGNVYATAVLADGRHAAVLEYGHAGNGPMAILKDGQYAPGGCAVDPTTGNLAVANTSRSKTSGNVAIFAGARGVPTYRRAPGIFTYDFCGYDPAGNLYVSGTSKNGSISVAELGKGSTHFVPLILNKPLYAAGPIEWDGKHLALGYGDVKRSIVYRTAVAGSQGKVVATTQLSIPKKPHAAMGPFWIADGRIAATFKAAAGYPLALWAYPTGGDPVRIVRGDRHADPQAGITVSVAASR